MVGTVSPSSLPGLTRQSIFFCKNALAKRMDPRVKPAGDAREWVSAEPIRTGTALVARGRVSDWPRGRARDAGRAAQPIRERENCDGDHIADDRGLVALSAIGTRTGAPHMNSRLVAGVLALLVSGSSAQASMTLSSWLPAQKAAATTTSTATTPSDAAPGKARAPVSTRTVTKPSVDTPATAAATAGSAGSKRDKIEQAEDRDGRSEESAPHKARRGQRAADAAKGDDDDARSSRKRGLEKIGRMLEAMHRMRPNFFARWR